MVNVKIDEEKLLELLTDRLEYWTGDIDVQVLFEDYYSDLIYNGCFEGADLDVMYIVDNDYVNNFSVITKDDFANHFIEDEDDERIVMTYNDLYLVNNRG